MVAVAALLFVDRDVRARSAEPVEQYEITMSYETSEERSDGSTGRSSGREGLLERFVGARDGGLELEYDLPLDATAEDRARTWQFPARVMWQPGRPLLLLNPAELEARLDRWLAAAEWTRDVCGRWIFTWNAFRIECDPQSVIETLEDLDLRSPDLREGGLYRDRRARGSGALRRIADGPDGSRLAVVLEIDPDAVRRARAEADVALGEIMRTPVTLEAAVRARAGDTVSGTIEVAFDLDSTGKAWRRTKVTRVEIIEPGGRTETRIATETVERRLMSDIGARR